MKTPSELRERRSQRDYSLPFKLAMVGTVCLSLVTDAYSRRIVGHHVHASLPSGSVPGRERGRRR